LRQLKGPGAAATTTLLNEPGAAHAKNKTKKKTAEKSEEKQEKNGKLIIVGDVTLWGNSP